MRFQQTYFSILAMLYMVESSANKLPIGVIFHKDSEGQIDNSLTAAYRYEYRRVNLDWGKGMLIDHGPINFTHTYDSFAVMTAMCSRMAVGVVVLIVDSRPSSYNAMVSLANTQRIPLLLPFGSEEDQDSPYEYDFSLFPSYIHAIADWVEFNRWTTVYYLYEPNEQLRSRLQQLFLAAQGEELRPRFIIRARAIENITNCYELLRTIDRLDPKEPKRIIIDLNNSADAYQSILDQIVDVGMNRDGYHYMLGALGIEELNKLDTFIHGGVNITGFGIINKKSNLYKNQEKVLTGELKQITYRKALWIDTVRVLEHAIRNLKELKIFRKNTFFNGNQRGIPCHGDPWEKGPDVRRAIANVNITGLTGRISFNKHGRRENYTLFVYHLEYKKKLREIGTWRQNRNPRLELKIPQPSKPPQKPPKENRTLIITTVLDEPFCQRINWNGHGAVDGKPFIDGHYYEGYAVDLAKLISKSTETQFQYTMRLVGDDNYGSPNETSGQWNGMVGELLSGVADMAIAPLTINEIRQRVVDFTKPFMKTGISIMIKKPDKQKPGVFVHGPSL
ncbi:hypothetical protein ScPMuIL_010726 [Solemya velum]